MRLIDAISFRQGIKLRNRVTLRLVLRSRDIIRLIACYHERETEGMIAWGGRESTGNTTRHDVTGSPIIARSHLSVLSFSLSPSLFFSLSLSSPDSSKPLPHVRARVQVAMRVAAYPAFRSFIIVVSARREQWDTWTADHHGRRRKAVGSCDFRREANRDEPDAEYGPFLPFDAHVFNSSVEIWRMIYAI